MTPRSQRITGAKTPKSGCAEHSYGRGAEHSGIGRSSRVIQVGIVGIVDSSAKATVI